MRDETAPASAGRSEAPCSVEYTTREVIEQKLLVALDDEGKVAALFSEHDLDVLIGDRGYDAAENRRMIEDLKQLRAAAFGTPNAAADRIGGHPNE